MPQSFDTLTAIYDNGFDTLIDVRSPAEFAEDHIPGAINLPSLSNEERAEVGTIYKQVSPFLARKVGAAKVLRNVADHIDHSLMERDGAWQPLVYCWRGGQRSGVFAMVLREVGWRADTIKGGYQTYRRLVQSALYETALPHRLILLDGYTGTAKTALLAKLTSRGVQTLDLEGLAGHRGSLLGAMPGGQPAQRGFETQLMLALSKLDPSRPTIVEAESSKIGQINLPPQLWALMSQASRIDLTATIEARTAYLAEAYADILADPTTVNQRLSPLRKTRGHAVVEQWQALQDKQDYAGLACALMQDHYDPSYAKSRRIEDRDVIAEVHAKTLCDDGQNRAADEIVTLLKAR